MLHMFEVAVPVRLRIGDTTRIPYVDESVRVTWRSEVVFVLDDIEFDIVDVECDGDRLPAHRRICVIEKVAPRPGDSMRTRRIAISVAFVAGLATLPLPAAKAQYYPPYSPPPLSWPICAAGAVLATATTIITAPFRVLTGAPPFYYVCYGPPPYYPPPAYYAPGYSAPPNSSER